MRILAIIVTTAMLAAMPVVAQEADEPRSTLQMDRTLGELSLSKLADGSAADGRSRLQTTRPYSSRLPFFLLGAIMLTLAGLGAGVVLGRRKSVVISPRLDRDAPVPLWMDAEKLQADLEALQTELDRQREANQEQVSALEQHEARHAGELNELRGKNDALIAEREQLLLRHTDQLHNLRATNDALNSEIQALRQHSGDGGVALAGRVIEQLRTEKDALAQELRALTPGPGAQAGTDQSAFEALRAERDALAAELETLQEDAVVSELQQARQTIDELQAQIAQLAFAEHNDPAELEKRVSELEDLLREALDANESSERLAAGSNARVSALEEALANRERELDQAKEELRGLHDKAALLEQAENHIAEFEAELARLRDETTELRGKTGQYKIIVPELASKLVNRQQQIGALESDLAARTHEIEKREKDAHEWQAQVEALQQSLAKAEIRIASLNCDLIAATEQNDLLRRDPDTEQLHEEIVGLKRDLRQSQQEFAEQHLRLQEVHTHQEKMEEWKSSLQSLEAEVRRKATLIDSQADRLSGQEQLINQQKAEITRLRQELLTSNRESDSLRGVLNDGSNKVVALHERIGLSGQTTQAAAPTGQLTKALSKAAETEVDLLEADIEALRSTARNRCNMRKSLETVLAEEKRALEAARQRIAQRDEDLVSLKNEVAANRVTIVALQARIADADGTGRAAGSEQPMQATRNERQLQESVKVLESMRADLHKWQRRVKPLHEAVVARDERIHCLEAELTALRAGQGLGAAASEDQLRDNTALSGAADDNPEQERERCLADMKQEWERIVSLETQLAEVDAKLARMLELDDTRCKQIETLEMARAAQLARLNELRQDEAVLQAKRSVEVRSSAAESERTVSMKLF